MLTVAGMLGKITGTTAIKISIIKRKKPILKRLPVVPLKKLFDCSGKMLFPLGVKIRVTAFPAPTDKAVQLLTF
jgi:hypothetical protein